MIPPSYNKPLMDNSSAFYHRNILVGVFQPHNKKLSLESRLNTDTFLFSLKYTPNPFFADKTMDLGGKFPPPSLYNGPAPKDTINKKSYCWPEGPTLIGLINDGRKEDSGRIYISIYGMKFIS